MITLDCEGRYCACRRHLHPDLTDLAHDAVKEHSNQATEETK